MHNHRIIAVLTACCAGFAMLAAAADAHAASSPATGTVAPATQPVTLKGDVKVERTVIENGTKRQVYLDPKVVVPGDHLVFTTAYHNVGADVVRNFVVTNPLPAGVVLAAGTAPEQDVSVDGGKTWGRLDASRVPDGKGATRPASTADVTHLRWTIAALAPGAQGTLVYNAIVR
ncbi:MAG: hypothetical protein RLZZ427_1274 [Pseudomonadota bacterium]|jgi:uncharacterized repeat protein (TIGR01451 family)